MATIRKRGGKYQARIQRKGLDPISKSFINRTDAEKWARAIERDIDLGIYIRPAECDMQTFGALLARYRKEVSPTKRGGAMEAIRLLAMEKRPIAKLALTSVTPKALAAYRDERLKVVSATTVNRDLDDISAILNFARKEWCLAVANPVTEIRRPSKGKGRERVLEPEEEVRLMAALNGGRNAQGRYTQGTRNPWVKPAIVLALETAMRRGELLALEWQYVDLAKCVAYLPLTKNGDARTVPMSKKAVEALSALPRSIGGRVLPITPMALRKAFERACEGAGIADLHFHDLRHTATTRLAQKLPNLVELAAVTGHRDVRMLARYYHPKAEELARKLG